MMTSVEPAAGVGDDGVRTMLTSGCSPVPCVVPVKEIGSPAIVSEALCGPSLTGWKVGATVQVAPGASTVVFKQVLTEELWLIANAAFPVRVIGKGLPDESAKVGALPIFVTVNTPEHGVANPRTGHAELSALFVHATPATPDGAIRFCGTVPNDASGAERFR